MSDPAATPVEDSQAVGISADAIMSAYQQSLADETQRRIVAEATVAQLLQERAELRAALAELQTTTAPNPQ